MRWLRIILEKEDKNPQYENTYGRHQLNVGVDAPRSENWRKSQRKIPETERDTSNCRIQANSKYWNRSQKWEDAEPETEEAKVFAPKIKIQKLLGRKIWKHDTFPQGRR